MCGNSMFADPPTVFLGSSPFTPSCPAGFAKDLQPRDGVWLRELIDAMKPTTAEAITQGQLNGLDVTVIDTHRSSDRAPSPAVDLTIRVGTQTLWLTLGTGPDVSIARAIIHSLTAATAQPAPTGRSTNQTPPANTAPPSTPGTTGTAPSEPCPPRSTMRLHVPVTAVGPASVRRVDGRARRGSTSSQAIASG